MFLKFVPVTTTTQPGGPLVGVNDVVVGGRERRGLEAEHHQGHCNPDSGYASADVPFTQTHSIVLSFRIDIFFFFLFIFFFFFFFFFKIFFIYTTLPVLTDPRHFLSILSTFLRSNLMFLRYPE